MADLLLYSIIATGFITGAVAVAVLFWASSSSRSVAWAGILAGAIAMCVGASGYLACLFPQFMRYCIHAGALSSRSGILIALGLGALLTSLAILAYTTARSILRKTLMPPDASERKRSD